LTELIGRVPLKDIVRETTDVLNPAGSRPVFAYLTNRLRAAYLSGPLRGAASWITEDVMRLQLRCHGDIDLSQPGVQVEIRSHIARCLRDYPNGGEGVITLAGVEHCFMYVVQNDVVDTVIGPPEYIEQVFNEDRQDTQEGQSRLPRKDHD
jgi:hypothetical protein